MADGNANLLWENNDTLTFESGAAIAQYQAVTVEADGQVDPAAATATFTDTIAGIAMGPATAAGEKIAVATSGKVVCIADAAIAQGAQVTGPTTTAGRVATAAAGESVLGVALQAASGAGDLIQVHISRGQL